jgi:dipeptidyl aminopeptidase/acylaminoacyl peptidase
MASSYSVPDADMTHLMDSPMTPTLSADPTGTMLLQLTPGGMPSIVALALPELKLGGLRFSPDLLFPTRMDSNGGRSGTDPKVLDVSGGDAAATLEFEGLPAGFSLSFVKWAPSGGKLAFMARPGDDPSAQYQLWLGVCTGGSVTAQQLLPGSRFNAVTGPPFAWSKDGTKLLVKIVPPTLGELPAAPPAPPGPTIQDNSDGEATAARTYQDMISSPHDELLFAHCSTAALQLLDVDAGSAVGIGPSDGMMLRGSHSPSNSGAVDGALDVSPDGKYVIAQRFTTPFSYQEQFSKFGYFTEIFSAETGDVVSTVYESPLQEAVPTHTDGVVTGPRYIQFHSSLPSTLVYASAADGGDPLAEIDGPRDELYFLAAPFEMSQAKCVLQMDLRFRRALFVDNGDVMVTEQRWSDRLLRQWRVTPEGSTQQISQRSSEDRYADPGTPLLDANGMASCDSSTNTIMLSGLGASDFGDRPFLDSMSLAEGSSTRLWRSPAGPAELAATGEPVADDAVGVFEQPIAMLTGNRLLISRESNASPPNYSIVSLADSSEQVLTSFAHPQPELTGITKQLIKYDRDDGVGLTANLYLPADFTPGTSAPLPCLMWAYPREFKDAAAASQIRESYVCSPLPFPHPVYCLETVVCYPV